MKSQIHFEITNFSFLEKENVIGYKTKTGNKKEIVVEICCNVQNSKIKLKSSVKGTAIQSLKAFTCGTNSVTEHQVSVQFIYFQLDIILQSY